MEPPRPRPEPDCDRKMRAGYAPRRDPVDIAEQIFFACDSNGDDALTWTEVSRFVFLFTKFDLSYQYQIW